VNDDNKSWDVVPDNCWFCYGLYIGAVNGCNLSISFPQGYNLWKVTCFGDGGAARTLGMRVLQNRDNMYV
jgi:hypothetical protein